MVVPAVDRCAALIAELAGGTIRPGVVDCHPRQVSAPEVRLRWARPAQILGMAVEQDDARKILVGLGFTEKAKDADGATWQVPSWRADVSIEEDLVEEIVRTKGYEAIPETLPHGASDTPAEPVEAQAVARIRAALEASGFAEAVNFSFVAERELAPFEQHVITGDGKGRALGITLKNPISADLSVMRTSLVPSLLKNVAHNLRQRIPDVRLYEIASIYHTHPEPRRQPSSESVEVAGVIVGRRCPASWATGADAADFFDAKASVAGILEALGVEVTWRPGGDGWLHPRHSAALLAGADVIGDVGELHPRVAEAFELPRGVLAFRLSLAGLVRAARLVPQHRAIPRLPAVLRDLAVVVDDGAAAAAVAALVRQEPLVEAVTLFDVYKGAPLPAGKKNLAFAIAYRAPDRTLTDAEADAAHGRIVKRLADELGAELRG
jgi:phenylalanyl-tRNA synthetase beta chain